MPYGERLRQRDEQDRSDSMIPGRQVNGQRERRRGDIGMDPRLGSMSLEGARESSCRLRESTSREEPPGLEDVGFDGMGFTVGLDQRNRIVVPRPGERIDVEAHDRRRDGASSATLVFFVQLGEVTAGVKDQAAEGRLGWGTVGGLHELRLSRAEVEDLGRLHLGPIHGGSGHHGPCEAETSRRLQHGGGAERAARSHRAREGILQGVRIIEVDPSCLPLGNRLSESRVGEVVREEALQIIDAPDSKHGASDGLRREPGAQGGSVHGQWAGACHQNEVSRFGLPDRHRGEDRSERSEDCIDGPTIDVIGLQPLEEHASIAQG